MLLGKAALAIYQDVPDEHRLDFDHWHTHEHLAERVSLPGFLRGRRYLAVQGAPAYFILYETIDAEVLDSEAYRKRLDAPTPWTARNAERIRRTIRSATQVRLSLGQGLGGGLLAARGKRADAFAKLISVVNGQWHNGLAPPGVSAVHLLEGDPTVSAQPTRERALRKRPDETIGALVLIEGSVDSALLGLWNRLTQGTPTLAGFEVGRYRLQAGLTPADLEARAAAD